jgi:hypothetical protein
MSAHENDNLIPTPDSLSNQTNDERAELLDIIGMLHKNMHNVKPTPGRFTDLSLEELRAVYSRYSAENAVYMEEYNNERDVAVAQFESEIERLMQEHQIDRATAVRWDVDASGLTDDVENFGIEYYEDMRGLPHGHIASTSSNNISV